MYFLSGTVSMLIKAAIDKDCILTDAGRQQAMETSRELNHILNDLSSSEKCQVSLLGSTLQRAKETTELLLDNDGIKNLVTEVVYDNKYREAGLRVTMTPTFKKELFHVL